MLVGPRLAYLMRRTWIDLHPKARDQRAHPDVVEQLAELKELARDVESGRVRLTDDVAPNVAAAIAGNGGGATIARMSRAQVAELLGCSPQNVSGLVSRGTLSCHHDGRGRLLFDADDVKAFLDERRAST